jgi:(E)-4-hydroxy-3-methylbut-2-enyl-diphosphate synthase
MEIAQNFCQSYFQYHRNRTDVVKIGSLSLGGVFPVCVQSMTTTNTLHTDATVEQALKIAEAGGELVRITTQGRRESENLHGIRKGLKERGCNVPLVADVHFNPSAAEIAASIVEKVRINPGNFTGGAKKFRQVEAESEEDKAGLKQIRERFVPFLNLCRQHHTAIRIGTNHGSLSDRIMSKFGDTPEGMVLSCMEYLRICREEDFHQIVLSIKSSNTRVMVHTVRLLVARMRTENMNYPLHLGVTEAGSGEDGRLKSAVGIGALMADGIGDTIRVSLTEPPENEIPVAKKLINYFTKRDGHDIIKAVDSHFYSPFEYQKRKSHAVLTVGGENPTAVVADVRESTSRQVGDSLPDMVLCALEQIDKLSKAWDDVIRVIDYSGLKREVAQENCVPLYWVNEAWEAFEGPVVISVSYAELDEGLITRLRGKKDVIIMLFSSHRNSTAEQRAFFMALQNYGLSHPVVVYRRYEDADTEDFQLKAASDTGILFLDGYGDGICLQAPTQSPDNCIATSFGILQASRVRFSKTEYISCPGCGRTLFDLQSTTETVREKTAHLKGLKIAVMGCIVNGIGEMVDADYGYVGAGPGKISLFRKRVLIKRNIPEKNAVDQLVRLIKENGDWHEPRI